MTFTMPGTTRPSTIPQILPTTNWVASAQLPLYDGMATTSRVDAASKAMESAESEITWLKFKISRDIEMQYYKAIATRALLEVAKQNLKTMNDHLKDVKLSKKVGLSTDFDILRVEVQTSEAQAEVLNAEDNVAMAQIRLEELIGSPASGTSGESLEPVGSLPQLGNAPEQISSKQATIARDDLVALERRIDGLSATYQAASKSYYPRLSLFTQYQYYNNQNDRFVDADSFRAAWMSGLSLNWTLFDGRSSSAKANQIASDMAEAEAVLSSKRNKGRTDAELWRRKLHYYSNLSMTRRGDVSKSEESLRLAKVGQKEGTRTTTDLLDAEAELFRSKANEINAQIGAIESLINFEIATGQKIKDLY